MTGETTAVDTAPDLLAAAAAPHDAVMWTVKAIADRDRVSKQAVSKRAKKFAADHSLIVERDARERIVRLNVVQYDQLRGKFADAAHAQAAQPIARAERAPPAPDSREEAQRRQAWTDAERSRLALEEQKGDLVRADDVRTAIADAADRVAGIIDRLPNAADDLAAAVARDGTHGLRVGLTKESARLRSEIAAALRHALSHEPQEPQQEAAPGAEPVQP